MDDIAKEFQKLTKRSDLGKCVKDVDECIHLLEMARAQIVQNPQSSMEIIAQLRARLRSKFDSLNEDQKEIYNGLSKFGKTLDKRYKGELSLVNNEAAFENKSHLVQRAIAMHLIREGRFNIARDFIKQADIEVPDSLLENFSEMYQILEAMRQGDLLPAISWAESKRSILEQRGSHLEFDLHRLMFVQIFLTRSTTDALAYARTNFTDFQSRYLSEIQRLMCAFLYSDKIHSSPYANLFASHEAWDDVAHSFTREFCSLLGLSADSPLHIAATAGAIALPQLLKMSTIMKEKRTEWSSQDELPVEIPLPSKYQYHSIFVCPVSKEQTTENNPPMMMPCGHVIAKESLGRLSKSNSQRFKCPYCPGESLSSQAAPCTF